MTRLTNAFSKKVENHAHAMALHFLYYNFVRIHQTLKVTPLWPLALRHGFTQPLRVALSTPHGLEDALRQHLLNDGRLTLVV